MSASGTSHAAADGAVSLHTLKDLIDERLFASAVTLASFAVSEKRKPEPSIHFQVKLRELFATALVGNGEPLRAVAVLQDAVKQLSASKKASEQLSRINKLHTRIVSILAENNRLDDALDQAKRISATMRSAGLLATLAEIYHKKGNRQQAIDCYKQVCYKQPYAIQAPLALLSYGYSPSSLIEHYRANLDEDHAWIVTFLQALGSYYESKHKVSLSLLDDLLQRFPDNEYVLRFVGECIVEQTDMNGALEVFEKLSSLHPFFVDGMDTYASLLKFVSNRSGLNRLAMRLQGITTHRAEVWLAVAMYLDLVGQTQRALGFAEKALAIDGQHRPAHLVRGMLLYDMDNVDEGIKAFRAAYLLRKDFQSFQGLIDGKIQSGKILEALAVANHAQQVFPENAQALTLLGSVLSHYQDGKEKASKMLEKALEIDPTYTPAAIYLGAVYSVNNQVEKAIEVMKGHLEVARLHKAPLLTQLASVYQESGNSSEALLYYNRALAEEPTFKPAEEGLKKLQRELGSGNFDEQQQQETGHEEDEEEEYDEEEEEDDDEEDDEEDEAEDSFPSFDELG
mmetsp:Transcript_560/g.1641  ORF Transcript_560/g.1641 Transcript_560/m.1641 type:complete len:568 (+) Transcript_560:125-1828(+)